MDELKFYGWTNNYGKYHYGLSNKKIIGTTTLCGIQTYWEREYHSFPLEEDYIPKYQKACLRCTNIKYTKLRKHYQ